MLKPILFAAAVLAAAVNVSPAFATPISPEVRTVSFADLDLSTAAGRGRLEQRRQAAVRECLVETRANVRLPGRVVTALAGTR